MNTHLDYLLYYFCMRSFASKIVVWFYRAWHGRITNFTNYFAANFNYERTTTTTDFSRLFAYRGHTSDYTSLWIEKLAPADVYDADDVDVADSDALKVAEGANDCQFLSDVCVYVGASTRSAQTKTAAKEKRGWRCQQTADAGKNCQLEADEQGRTGKQMMGAGARCATRISSAKFASTAKFSANN